MGGELGAADGWWYSSAWVDLLVDEVRSRGREWLNLVKRVVDNLVGWWAI